MKKIFSWLSIIGCVVAMGLFYVSLQTELIRVSYSIDKKRHFLADNQDALEQARLRVMELRSFDHLEHWISTNKMPLVIAEEVESLTGTKLPVEVPQAGMASTHIGLPFIQFIREAHAETVSNTAD